MLKRYSHRFTLNMRATLLILICVINKNQKALIYLRAFDTYRTIAIAMSYSYFLNFIRSNIIPRSRRSVVAVNIGRNIGKRFTGIDNTCIVCIEMQVSCGCVCKP